MDTTKIDGAGMVPVRKVDTGRRFWLVVDATKLDEIGIVPVGQVDTGRGLAGGGYSEVRWYWYGTCQEGGHRRRFGRWVVHVGCHRRPVLGSE